MRVSSHEVADQHGRSLRNIPVLLKDGSDIFAQVLVRIELFQ